MKTATLVRDLSRGSDCDLAVYRLSEPLDGYTLVAVATFRYVRLDEVKRGGAMILQAEENGEPKLHMTLRAMQGQAPSAADILGEAGYAVVQ